MASVHYFSKVFPGQSLKESSVRTWKMKYLQEIAANRRAGEEIIMKELVNQKTGHPLLLRENLDKQVQAYLEVLQENRVVVNTVITTACVKGVVKALTVTCWSATEGTYI